MPKSGRAPLEGHVEGPRVEAPLPLDVAQTRLHQARLGARLLLRFVRGHLGPYDAAP